MKLFNNLKAFSCLAVLLSATVIAACDGSNNPEANTAPAVISTSPAADSTDVFTNRKVTAKFSESMNASTLDSLSFTVAGLSEAAVTGTVTFDESIDTATFTPSSDFSTLTLYQATITTGAEDQEGGALANDFTWQFTTGATADTSAPTVTTTDPSDGALGVPLNRHIAATFSEDLDPTTVTSETFVVTDANSNEVSGEVTVVGLTTALFEPTNDFQANSTYTATLTTSIADLAIPANALAAAYVWAFTTGETTASGPDPVSLGAAGDYVILAKSEITTTGTTDIVGDLGISPAAQTYMTGFSESLDASNEFATSALVTGKLYAADMALPTPSNLTTAISNMETAYTDAAGRSNPDHTELGAGDISGKTLQPGLYAWGTSLLMTADVTLSGSEHDVWIFQVAQDVTVGNGVAITLEGGALPANIYWQVAGQVTLGTTSDFKGIILSQTKIVLNTGAVLNGRALAQTAVNLDANAVTQPAE